MNNHTLQIALKEPTPYFTNLLALPAFLPVNHEFADKHKKDYGTSKDTISTNGAFNLTKLDGLGTSDSWVIEKIIIIGTIKCLNEYYSFSSN